MKKFIMTSVSIAALIVSVASTPSYACFWFSTQPTAQPTTTTPVSQPAAAPVATPVVAPTTTPAVTTTESTPVVTATTSNPAPKVVLASTAVKVTATPAASSTTVELPQTGADPTIITLIVFGLLTYVGAAAIGVLAKR